MGQPALFPIVSEQGQAIAKLDERLIFAVRKIEQVDAVFRDHQESVHLLDKRIVALEIQIAELKRTGEEADRRRWTLVLAAFGVILTLVANIVVTLIRR